MAQTNEELEARLDALERSNNELMTTLFARLSDLAGQVESYSALIASIDTQLRNKNIIQP